MGVKQDVPTTSLERLQLLSEFGLGSGDLGVGGENILVQDALLGLDLLVQLGNTQNRGVFAADSMLDNSAQVTQVQFELGL